MDQDRAIRFAIPPFFLFASLLWGAHLGGCDLSAWLLSTGNVTIEKLDIAKELLGLLAATAVAIVPVGFLISSLSVFLLRFIALIARKPTYEAVLDNHTLQRIWNQLYTHPQAVNRSQTLYGVATFDHELLKAGIHTWLLRRWNSFNVAAHSIVALVLAHVVAPIFSIPQTFKWGLSTVVLVLILFINALQAWRETMGMIEFQSHRQQSASQSSTAPSQTP